MPQEFTDCGTRRGGAPSGIRAPMIIGGHSVASCCWSRTMLGIGAVDSNPSDAELPISSVYGSGVRNTGSFLTHPKINKKFIQMSEFSNYDKD
ncbi:hypothetical protein ACLOJK_028772 [Asimina triloba]